MRIACIALIAVLMMTIVGCSSKPRTTPLSFVDTVSSTDLSQEQGEAIMLGISKKSLIAKLGKPERTMNEATDFLMMYENYQFTSRDNTITGYSLGPHAQTSKQVKVTAIIMSQLSYYE